MTSSYWDQFEKVGEIPQHPLPDGFHYVDEEPPEPPPATNTPARLAMAGASGTNLGTTAMVGGPVDIAAMAARGIGLPVGPAPIMGSKWLRDMETKYGMGPEFQAASIPEKLAQGAGYGVASSLVPAAIAPKLGATAEALAGAPSLQTAGIGAAAGTTGTGAQEAAPEGYKEAAGLAGSLLGGTVAGRGFTMERPGAPQPGSIEEFLQQADVAQARAAGAKTHAEIQDFLARKQAMEQAAGTPALPAPQPQGMPPEPAPQAAGPAPAPPSPAPEVPAAAPEPAPVAPVPEHATNPIEAAREEVNNAPSIPQTEAGNYKKGHTTFEGLPV